MVAPADPVRGEVLIGRLEAVERLGETGVGGFGGFEFIPERAQICGLIGGQEREDARGGGLFGVGDGGAVGIGIERRVARVDLDVVCALLAVEPEPAPEEPSVSLAPVAPTPDPIEEESNVLTEWWLWTIVGVVVVGAVVAGVAIALTPGQPPESDGFGVDFVRVP